MHLIILTPEKKVYEGSMDMLQVPAEDGLMGILNNHAPIIANLKAGSLKIQNGDHFDFHFVSGGFLEFSKNKAVVLADASEQYNEMDIERVKQSMKRAKIRIEKGTGDILRAKKSLARALAREVFIKRSLKNN